MASITRPGTCVPPGPSKNTAGRALGGQPHWRRGSEHSGRAARLPARDVVAKDRGRIVQSRVDVEHELVVPQTAEAARDADPRVASRALAQISLGGLSARGAVPELIRFLRSKASDKLRADAADSRERSDVGMPVARASETLLFYGIVGALAAWLGPRGRYEGTGRKANHIRSPASSVTAAANSANRSFVWAVVMPMRSHGSSHPAS